MSSRTSRPAAYATTILSTLPGSSTSKSESVFPFVPRSRIASAGTSPDASHGGDSQRSTLMFALRYGGTAAECLQAARELALDIFERRSGCDFEALERWLE